VSDAYGKILGEGVGDERKFFTFFGRQKLHQLPRFVHGDLC